MYEYFGGVAKDLVPDNCKTAVIHNGKRKDQQINQTYQELAEYYGTAIIPARVRKKINRMQREPLEIYLRGSSTNEAGIKLILTFNQNSFKKREYFENEKDMGFELSDWKSQVQIYG